MKKYIITVGLNDKDSRKQKHLTSYYYRHIYRMLDYLAVDGATLTESKGYYTHDDGGRVKEKSINIELMFIEESTVRMLAKLLLKKFNQESVILAEQEINSNLYKG